MLVRERGVYLTVFVSEEQAEAWIQRELAGQIKGRNLNLFAKTVAPPASRKNEHNQLKGT